MPLPNRRSSVSPASVAPAASRVTHGAPKTPPMRHPISSRLRNLDKRRNLEGTKKMRTHTTFNGLPAAPRNDNHPAGIRRKTVQPEPPLSRNPNGFITAPPYNRSS